MVSIAFKTLLDRSKDESQPPVTSGIHSGNAGDILYSLPSAKAVGVRHLILNVYRGPDPNRKLTQEVATALVPLLLAQEYIDRVSIVTAGVPLEGVDPDCIGVDYVLDRFRNQDFTGMHLMQAHARALGVDVDPNEPFLTVPPLEGDSHIDVILSLTPRYRALTDEFVRELGLYFENVVAVGIPEEWRAISGFNGRVRKCDDFLELAQLIQRARLFIGNPSLSSAIAEGLKVPRIVDLPSIANAFPIGPRGYILPTRRADFFDIVHHLCPENLAIRSLYADLTEALLRMRAENEKLRKAAEWGAACLKEIGTNRPTYVRDAVSLLREAENGHAVLSGGSDTRVDIDTQGIYLHPDVPGGPEASIRFPEVDLTGFDAFECQVEVNHEHADTVCFIFRLYDAEGTLLIESTKEVPGATKTQWRVQFPPIYSNGAVELATKMAASAHSEQFAWAWFRSPQLRMG